MIAALLALCGAAPLIASEFVVVVHPDNPIENLEKEELSAIYLKKVDRWEGSAVIQPVDLVVEQPLRGLFSREVHGRSGYAVRAYWQRKLFAGQAVPPVELRSDLEVLEFVRSHSAAIGYVSVTVDTKGVKRIDLID